MLRRPRTVQAPMVLADWNQTSTEGTRNVQVLIEGVDPRLVLVPQLWVTGAPERSAYGVHVQWSVFSVADGIGGSKIVLHVVENADARVIGPTLTPRALDGIAPAGDNLEINAATDLLVVIACNAGGADGPDGQRLWFRLDAYPDSPSLSPEDYSGLLEMVRVRISNQGSVECLSGDT